jgi:metal-responsive CopG/Arc/MetJ family transcriptional regulator
MSVNTRTQVVISQDLVTAIDGLVGKRGRSQFIAQATAKELRRRRQLEALRQATGAWKAADHPELKRGAVAFVKELRREGGRRVVSVTRRP